MASEMRLTNRERSNLSLIRVSNRDLNKIKISKSNTLSHEMYKAFICKILQDAGHMFATEAIFNNGSRADVVDLTAGTVYEVLKSEKVSDFQRKRAEYPQELTVLPIKVLNDIDSELKIIAKEISKCL